LWKEPKKRAATLYGWEKYEGGHTGATEKSDRGSRNTVREVFSYTRAKDGRRWRRLVSVKESKRNTKKVGWEKSEGAELHVGLAC